MGFEPRQNLSGLETVNKFMKRMEFTTKKAVRALKSLRGDRLLS